MAAAAEHVFSDTDRLRLLVDAVTDYAIFMLDPDGFVTSWNSGAERIKGYRAGEVIGQHYSRFFTPEDQAAGMPARNLARAAATGTCEVEGWRVRKDGARFFALAVLHSIRSPTGALIGFAKITRDITERQAAQAALRDSERRFRLLVEGVVDYAIFLLDPSGVVTNWNHGAERLHGYRADEIVGQHFSRFYDREDRARGLPAQVIDEVKRTGRYEAEGWRLRNDGSRFWASVVLDAIRDETGELIGFAKITRDVTERRAAQEAMRESERQFRLLVQGVTDYALFMLDPNGIVTSWNDGAKRIKGYAAEEIIGEHFSRFYTEPDRAAGAPARVLQTARQDGRFEAEAWRVRKDGSLFWAHVILDAIRDETGTLIGFAKITRDLTERRNAQIALERAQAQRQEAQKMEALGHLTGGVAHDFNNLLMVVSGHIHTLRRLAGQDPAMLRAIDAVEKASRRGESLTRQLLTFSRRQTLNPAVADLGARLESVRALLQTSIGSAVSIAAAIPADTWHVRIDASEFELALLNIAMNARDAMPHGGTISLSAENATLGPEDTPAGLSGDFVALSVSDTGSGIAPDILPKVFDPFFTTKGSGKGTGLGLSQVHGFAHQSGGTVTIRSSLGQGTTITLYLPRAQAETAPAGDGEVRGEAADGHSVLLVEDNPDVAEVSQSLLEQLGYHVHVASDALAALDAIEREQRKFDLVVSDIVMAGPMDGLGLARRLRARHPGLAVLLVTGYTDMAGSVAAEFPVLRKPYQLADLHRATANAMSRAAGAPGNLVTLRDSRGAPPKSPT